MSLPKVTAPEWSERVDAVNRFHSQLPKVVRVPSAVFASVLGFLCLACAEDPVLTADLPLHLEDHLDAAVIEGSEIPTDVPQPLEWRFDEPQPGWRAVRPLASGMEPPGVSQTEEALRINLNTASRNPNNSRLLGAVYVDLPDHRLEDWSHVEVRARTSDLLNNVGVALNYTEDDPMGGATALLPLYTRGDFTPLVTDGTVQSYRIPLDRRVARTPEGPWTHLAVWCAGREGLDGGSLDVLSVRVIPRAAEYAAKRAGVISDRGGTSAASGPHRRAVYMHAPGSLSYEVKVPESGRLDVGLGVLRDDLPVTFSITATHGDGTVEDLFEEVYSTREEWGHRSVDLSHLAGETVALLLRADSDQPGTVALWASPTLTGSRKTETPNVIFYVIDGAGAEYMSLYGYNRGTTPNIDRLAQEGAVFERAYSNASWTMPSTASFMTSLQHSVLGGIRNGFNVVPEDARTMAQHFHNAAFQTAVFTANPNAGRLSGLERGVDFFREGWAEFDYFEFGNYRESSKYLHQAFWDWRETYPGEPYWVHFQTVDIHSDFPAPAPFGGLFVGPDELKVWEESREDLREYGGPGIFSEAFDSTGIDRVGHYAVMQGLYDEAMAFNDDQLGLLVERLKAEGEWENTLLVVGADHSIRAAMADMGLGIQDSLPPPWSRSIMLRPSISRVPLLFVWPGKIPGRRRFSEPVVSMIDVLPTVLELTGLPLPEIMQGQSLAPLLLGDGPVEDRPVILDEFRWDLEAGEFRGVIEIIDGRWGASLEINPEPPEEDETEEEAMGRRPVPLLLYDLWNDPYCLHSIHEERPDLVEKYTAFLEEHWEAHQALGQYFTPSEDVVLTSEQIEMLRTLGYIR